MGPKNKRTIA